MKSRVLALGAALVVAIGGFGISPASAENDPGDELTVINTGGATSKKPSKLLPEEAALVAKDLGISSAEADARFSGQEDFLLALTEAIESAPDRYSDSAWEKGRGSQAWVAFTGAEDPNLIEIFADLPIRVEVNRPDFRSVLQVRMEHDEQEVFAGDA